MNIRESQKREIEREIGALQSQIESIKLQQYVQKQSFSPALKLVIWLIGCTAVAIFIPQTTILMVAVFVAVLTLEYKESNASVSWQDDLNHKRDRLSDLEEELKTLYATELNHLAHKRQKTSIPKKQSTHAPQPNLKSGHTSAPAPTPTPTPTPAPRNSLTGQLALHTSTAAVVTPTNLRPQSKLISQPRPLKLQDLEDVEEYGQDFLDAIARVCEQVFNLPSDFNSADVKHPNELLEEFGHELLLFIVVTAMEQCRKNFDGQAEFLKHGKTLEGLVSEFGTDMVRFIRRRIHIEYFGS